MVWTCWGRPSLGAQAVIRSLASVAARRRGLADPRPLEVRSRTLIGAQIWRRAAAMVLACLQRTATAGAEELLPAGEWDEVGDYEEVVGVAAASDAASTTAAPGVAAAAAEPPPAAGVAGAASAV